jgi:orotidine-5'-phosphate decarboxylase
VPQPPAFGERLAERVLARESQIVLGLDPDPGALWPGVEEVAGVWGDVGDSAGAGGSQGAGDSAGAGDSRGAGDSPAQRAASAVQAHCRALIDAAGPACVAVKPQLACFERLGAPGRVALEAVVRYARDAGLLVIADGKRGDIDVTARAYAQSLFGGLTTPFGDLPGLGADMATVNPLMGSDAIAPFVTAARAAGAGVLALVRTSNPGAADVEELKLARAGVAAEGAGAVPAGAGTVWECLAEIVDELGRPGVGEGSGLSDVGAVLGATAPGQLARARELMPRAVFLLPGVGAQGGRVEDLQPAFAPGRAGGLVSASRSISGAYLADHGGGADPAAAARAEAERLRGIAWGLG